MPAAKGSARTLLGPKYLKIPLTTMGILAPGSAHARPSAQPPINVNGNFPAHVSGVGGGAERGLKLSKVFLINFLTKSILFGFFHFLVLAADFDRFEGRRPLCRHGCWKISASVDGGPSRGSRVRRPGSEDPHRR